MGQHLSPKRWYLSTKGEVSCHRAQLFSNYEFLSLSHYRRRILNYTAMEENTTVNFVVSLPPPPPQPPPSSSLEVFPYEFFAPDFHLSLFPTSTCARPRSATNSTVPSLHIRRGLPLRRPTGLHTSACGYQRCSLIRRNHKLSVVVHLFDLLSSFLMASLIKSFCTLSWDVFRTHLIRNPFQRPTISSSL